MLRAALDLDLDVAGWYARTVPTVQQAVRDMSASRGLILLVHHGCNVKWL